MKVYTGSKELVTLLADATCKFCELQSDKNTICLVGQCLLTWLSSIYYQMILMPEITVKFVLPTSLQ